MLLKVEMGLKTENFTVMSVHWKIHFLGEGEAVVTKKAIYRVVLLGQFADLREGA